MHAIAPALHVLRRSDLAERGLSRRDVQRHIEEGTLVPLGRHWLGTSQTPPDVAAALTRGQRLTCVSALRHHGLWTPLAPEAHEVAHRSTPHRPRTPGTVGHGILRTWPDAQPIIPIPLALEHACRCLPPDHAAVLLESALNLGRLSRWQVEDLLAGLPDRRRAAIGHVDHRAQSGTETIVRRFFEHLRVRVVPQVWIDDVGFVDMRVGERLVVECDSRAHHTDERAYAADRRRDLRLILAGFVVVRLTWADVMLEWERTKVLLHRLITEGRHRAPRHLRALDGS